MASSRSTASSVSTIGNIVGGIFKGRVKNIEPGLKAMFVDIGFEKNAFLHFWDAVPGDPPPAARDAGFEEIIRPEDPKRGPKKKRPTVKDIPSIYPVGSEVLVQVTKGPIGTKGPRVTTNLSMPGRYLVLMPYSDQSGISRKIDDPKERDRLRKILRQLDVPRGHGRHHAHRRRGPARAVFRARPEPHARAMARDRGSDEGQERACLPLRGARPHRPHRARFPH